MAKHTPRGFQVYAELKDSREGTVRVQESSDASGAYCWIFHYDRDGLDVRHCVGARRCENGLSYAATSPHLTRAQARRVAKALLRFAEGA